MLATSSVAPFTRLVHAKVTPAEIFRVERRNRGLGTLGVHVDEGKPTRATGFTVIDDRNLENGSVGCERSAQLFGRRVEWEVADIEPFV